MGDHIVLAPCFRTCKMMKTRKSKGGLGEEDAARMVVDAARTGNIYPRTHTDTRQTQTHTQSIPLP
jgi:hypothetical protein